VKVGDLVKFKPHCRPHWHSILAERVFLIDRINGGFVGLHNHPLAGLIAKGNFILVRKANENR